MDGIEYVHMNNTYVGQDRDGSFVYPDDSYFGGIASLVESVEVRLVIGGSSRKTGWNSSCAARFFFWTRTATT
jgi:hypothetical protein